ncbi:2-methylisoborneol synthase, partial [Streptomyces sp. ms191]
MPEPGLSPLQSSLPDAAARFGAHVLARSVESAAGVIAGAASGAGDAATAGVDTVGAEPSAPPARPALPTGPPLPFRTAAHAAP